MYDPLFFNLSYILAALTIVFCLGILVSYKKRSIVMARNRRDGDE